MAPSQKGQYITTSYVPFCFLVAVVVVTRGTTMLATMQQFVDRTTDDKQIKYVIRKYIKFTLLGFSGGWYTSRIGWLSCGGKPVCK